MNENKLIKFLIPLIAALVVFESIVLVTNLDKGTKTNTNTSNTVVNTNVQPSPTVQEPVAEMIFDTASKEMKVGKSYKVNLNVVAKKDLMVDGIEAYVKYDPSLVTVSGLVSNNKLPKASISKIDGQTGMIENVVLVDAKTGYKLTSSAISPILSFNVTPKKAGVIDFEISTGNDKKEFVTMIVENKTSNSLVFSTNKLEINATK
jgi:hypothetical protein